MRVSFEKDPYPDRNEIEISPHALSRACERGIIAINATLLNQMDYLRKVIKKAHFEKKLGQKDYYYRKTFPQRNRQKRIRVVENVYLYCYGDFKLIVVGKRLVTLYERKD